jgi:SAM-dependent methyltransferase
VGLAIVLLVRDELAQETANLRQSWAHHEPHWLRDYLVAGVEDPRVNLQSILTRHFLIRYLTGTEFEWCMAREYEFSAAAAWLANHAGLLADGETRLAVLHALRRGADNAEGIEVPQFLCRAFNSLIADQPVPNYLEALLTQQGDTGDAWLASFLNTFADLWARLLGDINPQPSSCQPSVVSTKRLKPALLEVACGSANDFRFLHGYGIAGLVDYTGLDLCSKNVENARALFPQVRFDVGNVFDINAPDKAFGLCMVHDLFEHLSIPGLVQAIKEVCRVTREGICIGFFQMDEISDHVVRPVDDYHWNLLSMQRTRHLFEQEGFGAQVIHVDSFLSEHAPGSQTHNPNAYTFFLGPG